MRNGEFARQNRAQYIHPQIGEEYGGVEGQEIHVAHGVVLIDVQGIVEEHVDATEVGDRLADHLLQIGLFTDIDGHRAR